MSLIFKHSKMMLLGRSVMLNSRCSCQQICRSQGRFMSSNTSGSSDLAKSSSTSGPENFQRKMGMTDIKVNLLEKYFLVWSGKYKSVNEVPEMVSQSVMERSRNHARIKINLLTGLGVLFMCFFMIWSGKKAASEGQSVTIINKEFHRKYNEMKDKEERDAATASASGKS